ncbi:MAG: YfdX family protein [Desulfomonile tiedjei]|nr:YfdX family protein [Desulfomonile tiedjei]
MTRNMVGPALTLVLAFLLGQSPTVSTAQAQDRISAGVKVVPEGRLSTREKAAVSYAAGKLLRHVDLARSGLRYRQYDAAAGNVDKALKLARIIENAVPTAKVTSVIRSGNLTYQDEENVKQLLVPVYPELDETNSLLFSIKRARREGSSQAAESAGASGDYQLQYTTVTLNVPDAKYYLEAADTALKKKDIEAADKALATIPEDVICEYDEQELPLAKARWELMSASRKLAQKDYKEAKEALQKAASSVEAYTAQTGEGVSDKARRVTDEIKDLASRIDQKKEGAAEAVHGLWEKVVNLP